MYLDGQKTGRDSALYTGWRFENRFRLLMKEHAVNPVLYVEYEDITGADRIFKEVVGFDTFEGLLEPADEARHEKKREVEAKLILSSNRKGWNRRRKPDRGKEPERRAGRIRICRRA